MTRVQASSTVKNIRARLTLPNTPPYNGTNIAQQLGYKIIHRSLTGRLATLAGYADHTTNTIILNTNVHVHMINLTAVRLALVLYRNIQPTTENYTLILDRNPLWAGQSDEMIQNARDAADILAPWTAIKKIWGTYGTQNIHQIRDIFMIPSVHIVDIVQHNT